MTIQSIEAGAYNKKLAEALKKTGSFHPPEWIHHVKSGPHKERPIVEEDFWYKRAASIMRQVYLRGIVGTQRLRTRYGGREDRGKQPAHFHKSSGKIIRLILQQSETAGLLEKSKGKKAGRQLTAKGKEFMESIK